MRCVEHMIRYLLGTIGYVLRYALDDDVRLSRYVYSCPRGSAVKISVVDP